MKRRLTAGLAGLMVLALLLAAFPLSGQAAGGQFAMVSGTSRLFVRSGRGTGYPAIGSAARGSWVEIFSSEGVWHRGKVLSSGLTGYLHGDYLKTAGSSGTGSQAVVNNPVASQFLNLRQYPSYAAPVLGIYYNGAVATVISGSEGWYYVEIGGQRGYFRGEFLRFTGGGGSPVGSATVYSSNGGSVNLRTGPGYSYRVLGAYAPGTVATVYLKGEGFWYVSIHGASGFMDSRFLRDGSGPVPTPPAPRPTPGTTNAIITPRLGSLNLREQASTSSRVLGAYPGNTAIIITKQGLTWCRVTVPHDGATGFMMTRYLTLYGLPAVPTLRVHHPSGSYVNLRTRPSQATGIVTLRVPSGSLVTVLTPGGEWTQVKYDGKVGYMMSYFLK